jgi:hypothetical protein
MIDDSPMVQTDSLTHTQLLPCKRVCMQAELHLVAATTQGCRGGADGVNTTVCIACAHTSIAHNTCFIYVLDVG